MKTNKLSVNTVSQKYPIIIGSGIIADLDKILTKNSIRFDKCLIIIDNKVPKYFVKKILKSITDSNKYIYYFKSSELNKDISSINKILKILLKNNFQRNDCLLSLGGGITGDVSGFAASIFKRGIKFINIPTTLLSQVDSSIGGKTGINSSYGKNLIGSFYQPSLVISDIDFLKTLPDREIICGYAEILKHSLISDKKFFNFLNTNMDKILNLKSPFIEKSIYKSCMIKKEIIQLDEKEKNLRKVLNFGHTFGHAYEATLKYSTRLNHGEAVLLGMMSASRFSMQNKLLPKSDFKLIETHLLKLKLKIKVSSLFSQKKLKDILTYMKKDKKNDTKKINLVLLKKIGKPVFNLNFDDKTINNFLKKELRN